MNSQSTGFGSYLVNITASLPSGVNKSIIVPISIVSTQSCFSITNIGPPVFTKALSDVSVNVTENLVFTFPSLSDPDSGDTASIKTLNLGTALPFTSGSFPILTFSPTQSN